jgi:hypothetical protein
MLYSQVFAARTANEVSASLDEPPESICSLSLMLRGKNTSDRDRVTIG